MTLTIARIAAKAINAARGAISDAVHDATLTHITQGDYDVVTGRYVDIRSTQSGRAVFQGAAPIKQLFPDYVVGPSDELVLIEGMTTVVENDLLEINSVIRIVRAVQDIGGAGTLFNVIAR